MHRLPNLNALRAFEAAARHESFTLAADEFGVTQAAVSRHVRNLERQLGIALFERGQRSIALTPEGAKYAERVREGFATIAGFTHKGSAETSERVAVDVDSDLLLTWLLPRLTEDVLARLGVQLDLRSRLDWPRSLPADTDLAIIWGATENAGFKCRLLLEQRAIVVCAPILADGRTAPRNVSELTRHRLIHERTDAWWREVLSVAGHALTGAETYLCFHRAYLAAEAAAAGLGIAVGDDVIFAGHLASGRLVRPCGPVLPGKRSFFILEPAGRRVASSVIRVRDWLMTEASLHAGWQRTFSG